MTFKVKCSKCEDLFESMPGVLNSTGYQGLCSVLTGAGGFLPQCPKCGNWRDNCLIEEDGSLSKPLRY